MDEVWTDVVSSWFDRAEKGEPVWVAVQWGYEGDEAKVGSMGPFGPSRGSGVGRLQATRLDGRKYEPLPSPPFDPEAPRWFYRLKGRLDRRNPFTDDWGKPGFGSDRIVTIEALDTRPTSTELARPALPTGCEEYTEGRMFWHGGSALAEGNGYSASASPTFFYSAFVTIRFYSLDPSVFHVRLRAWLFHRLLRRKPPQIGGT